MEKYRHYAVHTVNPREDMLSTTLDKNNLHKILEILCATDDVETHVKIFTVLAVFMTSSNDCNDDIITCKPMYDKIYNVLNNGLPLRLARTLNFVSVLLYVEDEEASSRAKSVVARARNMLRMSGCLLQMCTMFTSLMLHQETWRALCRCLAECCRNSYENQSYCSHLVPLCVKRCAHGSVDAMLPLKTLINKHARNLGLFMESSGVSIFNRELLQHDICMQLLNTLVQNLETETLSLLPHTLFQTLQYFKKVYGSHTKVGQWAIVVLHHLNCRLQRTDGLYFEEKHREPSTSFKKHEETCKTNDEILKPHYDETTKLLQNVIREIQLFNANNNANQNMSQDKVKNFIPKKNCTGIDSSQKYPINCRQKRDQRKQKESHGDMSFTFLRAQKSRGSSSRNFIDATSKQASTHNLDMTRNLKANNIRKELSKCHLSTQDSHTNRTSKLMHSSKIKLSVYNENLDIIDFKPIFVSTPKHLKDKISRTTNLSKHSQLSRYSHTKNKKLMKMKDKVQKNPNISNQSISVMHRSISSRLFDAINSSCTTFVKTVRNIFKPAKDTKKENSESKAQASCSYSFTEYMRNRDAALLQEWTTNKSAENNAKKSCNTCNDTAILKQKVADDDHLKDTVNKLKLGINLYGCDFKKIAKAMWPRETYMTPEVLYNLYRKLVIK